MKKENKITKALTLADKVVKKAKEEMNIEREEKLKIRAKSFLEEIQEAKRTVNLLEKQFKNWMREVNL